MAGKSTYAGIIDLKWKLQNTAPTPPTAIYLSLHTADPGNTGASEVSTSATGYARVACTTGTSGTGAGAVFGGAPTVAAGAFATSKATLTNASQITWPTATASWGTCTHVGVWDAATAGNFLGSTALTSAVTVGTGGTPDFPVAALAIAED